MYFHVFISLFLIRHFIKSGIRTGKEKLQGREAHRSPPTHAKAKNAGAIPPLPHTSSWRGA
jgi:hypothetical protein